MKWRVAYDREDSDSLRGPDSYSVPFQSWEFMGMFVCACMYVCVCICVCPNGKAFSLSLQRRHCPIQGHATANVPNCPDTHANISFTDTSLSIFADYFCQRIHKLESIILFFFKFWRIQENAYMSVDSSLCKTCSSFPSSPLYFRFACSCLSLWNYWPGGPR